MNKENFTETLLRINNKILENRTNVGLLVEYTIVQLWFILSFGDFYLNLSEKERTFLARLEKKLVEFKTRHSHKKAADSLLFLTTRRKINSIISRI